MKKDKSKTEAKGVGDLPKTVLFGLLIISAINMAPFLEILTGFNLISFASEKYPKHPYIFCMAVFI
ncbi:MAG: hypothetical protein K6E47_14830, partial [Lachnospiraceae bacterium]|nr:hypothetical protein [Lachnospiraceae bacterium]